MSGRSTPDHSSFVDSSFNLSSSSVDSLNSSSDNLNTSGFLSDPNEDQLLIASLIGTESYREKIRYDLPKIVDNYPSLVVLLNHIKSQKQTNKKVTRIVFVGVVNFILILEDEIEGFKVEVVIPFTYYNRRYYLIHLGLSRGSRLHQSNTLALQKDLSFLTTISNSPRYRPLKTEEMTNFLRNQQIEMTLELILLNPDNIGRYYQQIVNLVDATYHKNCPQIAPFIRETCGQYIYAGLVNQDDQLLTLNGFKIHQYEFIKIGELFSSLTTNLYKGFSAVSTRMFLEHIHRSRTEVDLIITFSRLGNVMKRNRRLSVYSLYDPDHRENIPCGLRDEHQSSIPSSFR